jgi:uncharacterized damage-inducible protein DinB
MSEIERITDQLKRAYQGPAWHGPSLRELLADLPPERAASKPLRHAHSIWEIVLHVRAWEDVARRRIGGEQVELSPEEDWPPVRGTDRAAWEVVLDGLERGHVELTSAIARLDEAKLLARTPGRDYSVYALLHGVIQHDLYHAGQIALLRKG